MTLVTIDIMMPFWGRVDHFKIAVDSVLAQDSGDWRLTIVDDGYPDPTAGEWARSVPDERVRYLRNDVNLGVSRNFRRCVDLMTADYGVLMGCDDIMLPGYVRRIDELLRRFPHASIIQPGVSTIDASGRHGQTLADRVKGLYRPRRGLPRPLTGERLARSLLRANWAYFPSLCWERRALEEHGFRLDMDIVSDLAMLLDITLEGGSLILDDHVVFDYRRHAASASAVTGPDGTKYAQESSLFFEMAERTRQRGWSSASRAARTHLTSRLHAVAELPAAARARNRAGLTALLRHAAGPNRPLGTDDEAHE